MSPRLLKVDEKGCLLEPAVLDQGDNVHFIPPSGCNPYVIVDFPVGDAVTLTKVEPNIKRVRLTHLRNGTQVLMAMQELEIGDFIAIPAGIEPDRVEPDHKSIDEFVRRSDELPADAFQLAEARLQAKAMDAIREAVEPDKPAQGGTFTQLIAKLAGLEVDAARLEVIATRLSDAYLSLPMGLDWANDSVRNLREIANRIRDIP